MRYRRLYSHSPHENHRKPHINATRNRPVQAHKQQKHPGRDREMDQRPQKQVSYVQERRNQEEDRGANVETRRTDQFQAQEVQQQLR